MICLFSLDDSEMMYAKTGDWFSREPWLANANNSVVLKRDVVSKKQFDRIFEMTKQWGEPGFYFTDDYDYATNPCCEIALVPKLTIDRALRERLAVKGFSVEEGATYTGWAFCNLCEINAAKLTSLDDFMEAARAATVIGTLQASYTKMPYLGWISEMVAERDALLGIGMTGMLDAPTVACSPSNQRAVAEAVKGWNRELAAMIGINPAARTTCVKPSGTTSLELGCVGSGHHPHHARRYIRRVIADELEPIFQALREKNPGMMVRMPNGKFVIEFPVEAPAGATVRADLTALQFLEMVRSTQQNWVVPGTARDEHAPGLAHNVSNTVTVRAGEWGAVANYLWDHRESFTGVSLLAETGDKDFSFAPHEEIVTEADEARWNSLLAGYHALDYSTLREGTDGTNLIGEAACVGGACAIV
jgi:ribonucleoside-diphosphate reductase alpha chain